MNSNAIALDDRAMRALHVRRPRASHLAMLNEAISVLHDLVQHRWNDIDPEGQDALRTFHERLQRPRRVPNLRARARAIWWIIAAGPDTAAEFLHRSRRFTELLAKTIAEDDARIQEQLARHAEAPAVQAALVEAWEDVRAGRVLTRDELMAKLAE